MKINLCTPTRGKPSYLSEWVGKTLANAVLPGTRIVIGSDDDDPLLDDIRAAFAGDPRVIHSTAPREDSLGAKYNRIAAACPADIYVMGIDDVAIITPGWDRELTRVASLFTDGIGFVYFGREKSGESLPSMIATTARTIEVMGFFCPPYFQFWWNNTWLDQLARLTGRLLYAPIETEYPESYPPSRTDPTIAWWSNVFDQTQSLRLRQAEKLLDACFYDAPWRKEQMRQALPGLLADFHRDGSIVRNPLSGCRRGLTSNDDPMNERGVRARAAASALLAQLLVTNQT